MLRTIELTLLLVIASVIRVGHSVAQNTVSSTSGRATQMNDCAANKTLVRKLFDEWVNKKNLAAIDGMVTPNYVSHEGGEDTNAEDTKKFLADLFRSAPDIHITIEDIVCEGDKVVVRNIWRATDTGGFGGMSPTGKSVVVEGFVMWRIENGKLAERWAVIDYRGLMRQLSTTSQSK